MEQVRLRLDQPVAADVAAIQALALEIQLVEHQEVPNLVLAAHFQEV
jgi:hypothetical protein